MSKFGELRKLVLARRRMMKCKCNMCRQMRGERVPGMYPNG